MRRGFKIVLLLATFGLVWAPSRARAEGYVSPFLGVNFGNSSVEVNNSPKGRLDFGFDVGWMGGGIAGFEFDFGYGPNFFGEDGDFGENHVLTAMGNVIFGAPIGGTSGGGLRPYGTVGVGLIRTQVTGTPGPLGVPKIGDNDFGINGGVGVMGFVSDHVGFRGDVRYFHNFRDEPAAGLKFGSFHFWRGSVGVVLR